MAETDTRKDNLCRMISNGSLKVLLASAKTTMNKLGICIECDVEYDEEHKPNCKLGKAIAEAERVVVR